VADLPTPAELAAAAQAAFRARLDPNGTGAVNLRPGSRHDLFVSVVTAVAARLSAYAVDRVTALRRSTATGTDLDDLARDLFSVTRKAANAATGRVRLVRAGTAATSVPKGTRFAVPAEGSTPAVVFEASEDVASSGTTAVVPVACAEVGTRGNIAGPSAVTAVLDPLPDSTWSLDPTYTTGVDSAAAFAGGAEAETDDELRDRLEQIAINDPRERATERAVLAATLAVPGVRYATVVEPFDGTLVVYAGDEAFALSDAMRQAIELELRGWRALGVPALARAYSAQTVTVTGTIYMARALSEYDAAAVKAAAVQAVKDYFATGRPQPDEYFVNAIEAACFGAHDEVQNVVLSAPLADVRRRPDADYGAVAALERYRVTDESITLSVAGPLTQ
jgi:uncharacterized phage protein gp47/JayE